MQMKLGCQNVSGYFTENLFYLNRIILQPFENYARNLERHFGSVLIDQRGTFEHQSSTLNLNLGNYSWFFYFGLSDMKSALLPYRPNRHPTFWRIIHCCQMVSIEKLLIKFLAMCWRMTISPWCTRRKAQVSILKMFFWHKIWPNIKHWIVFQWQFRSKLNKYYDFVSTKLYK